MITYMFTRKREREGYIESALYKNRILLGFTYAGKWLVEGVRVSSYLMYIRIDSALPKNPLYRGTDVDRLRAVYNIKGSHPKCISIKIWNF